MRTVDASADTGSLVFFTGEGVRLRNAFNGNETPLRTTVSFRKWLLPLHMARHEATGQKEHGSHAQKSGIVGRNSSQRLSAYAEPCFHTSLALLRLSLNRPLCSQPFSSFY